MCACMAKPASNRPSCGTGTTLACDPLPLHPFDIATVSQVRASRQFRITLETNRYSVPAHYAGQALTLKTYPDRLLSLSR